MNSTRFLYLCNILWPRLLASPKWQRLPDDIWFGRQSLASKWKKVVKYNDYL